MSQIKIPHPTGQPSHRPTFQKCIILGMLSTEKFSEPEVIAKIEAMEPIMSSEYITTELKLKQI